MKVLSVLGSTGSIGTQTLDIVRYNPDKFEVAAIGANSNVALLERQVREFNPKLVAVYDEAAAKELSVMIADTDTKVVSGMEGLIELATYPTADVVVTGIVGMIGIRPTIAAIRAGKDIALANKETLVCAGHIIMPLAKAMKVNILPVDSEHSAIFQSMNGFWAKEEAHHAQIEKILLTASGGPFRGKKKEELKSVNLEQVLNHPNWVMGPKVTIDSASLVNKGLEMMEAHWLFDMEPEKIQILIHPQSILHSAVQFVDGAVIGQMGVPDMKLPIQYALTYPDRIYLLGERVDFFKMEHLDFMEPDLETFVGLKLAFDAMNAGGVMPTVFNAANEVAVRLLLDKKIGFLQIPEVIEHAMNSFTPGVSPDVDEIFEARERTEEILKSYMNQI
ncbi:MAG: 1-deoxy-D-xylulose-5-phosphate reductoisomerase [Lachnospiraceae bacterium]|nr:1-deoxy-D-xylulose-5-phosphate reductoisomerase [Lachnospiraceae bacterium]